MNLLKLGIALLFIISPLALPTHAYTNVTCGQHNNGSDGNVSVNFTINGTTHCQTGNYFNITAVTVDTNITKNFSFDGRSNWSMGVRLIINNTDNSTNYTFKVYNSTNGTGDVDHNVTVKSNATGWVQFNLTNLNHTGYINMTRLNVGGSNTIPANYVYVAGFAAIIAGGALVYLRKIRKVG